MHLLFIEGSKMAADTFLKQLRIQSELRWTVQHLTDGFEAIEYLSGFLHFANRKCYPLPQIMLLGLNAMTGSGHDFLAWLRAEKQFRELPVIVASSTQSEAEEARAMRLAPHAWFGRVGGILGCHRLVDLCEDLVLNGLLMAPGPNRVRRDWLGPSRGSGGWRPKAVAAAVVGV